MLKDTIYYVVSFYVITWSLYCKSTWVWIDHDNVFPCLSLRFPVKCKYTLTIKPGQRIIKYDDNEGKKRGKKITRFTKYEPEYPVPFTLTCLMKQEVSLFFLSLKEFICTPTDQATRNCECLPISLNDLSKNIKIY